MQHNFGQNDSAIINIKDWQMINYLQHHYLTIYHYWQPTKKFKKFELLSLATLQKSNNWKIKAPQI